MNSNGRRKALASMTLTLLPAVAATAGTLDPWDTGLTKIMGILEGPTAAVIGGLCIIGGGILLAVTEGQAIRRIFWIVIGIGVAMNAGKILTTVIPGAVDPSTVQGFLVMVREGVRPVGKNLASVVRSAAHGGLWLAQKWGGTSWISL